MMRAVEIDVFPHRFRAVTAGAGPPLVLVHGLGGSSEWWGRNVAELSQSFEIWMIDLPGFAANRRFIGSSLPPPFEEMAGLLGRWIERDFDRRVHLIGHSMGGQISARLAASRPDLVQTLMLVSSTGLPFRLDPRPHLEALSRPTRPMIDFVPRLAVDAMRAGPGSLLWSASRIFLDDTRDTLARITIPVLLIWGADDPLVPPAYGEAMRELIPNADLVVIERAGHVPMWDAPQRFARHVMEFVTRNEHRSHGRPGSAAMFQWHYAGSEAEMGFRRSGDRAEVVLVHGLGIGSRYFRPLARQLYLAGYGAVAPDLPGTGHSPSAPVGETAEQVVRWADALAISEAIWIGHSNGNQTVQAVRRLRPDLVRLWVAVAPVWNRRRHPWVELSAAVLQDIVREPAPLLVEAISAYWKAGVARLVRQARNDLAAASLTDQPEADVVLYGVDDPLIDRDHLASVASGRILEVAGAHGVVYSNPAAIVGAVLTALPSAPR